MALQARVKKEFMLTAIACELFQRKHERWPTSMEELVPTYLSRLPTNPETSGQPLIQLQSIPDGYSLETQPLRGITEKGEPFVDRLTVIRK